VLLLLVEGALEIQQHGDLVLAEVTEVGIERLLHELREPAQTTLLRQRAERAVLLGADLDSGPHACMLARTCITSLGFKVPREIDQLAVDQFYTVGSGFCSHELAELRSGKIGLTQDRG
jgi:hypothetical protein